MSSRRKHTTCSFTSRSFASLHSAMPTRLTPALQQISGRGPESLRSFYPGHKGGREEPLTLYSSGGALRLADFPSVAFLLYLPPPNASLCNSHCSVQKKIIVCRDINQMNSIWGQSADSAPSSLSQLSCKLTIMTECQKCYQMQLVNTRRQFESQRS